MLYDEYAYSYFGMLAAESGAEPVSIDINTYKDGACGMLKPNTTYYVGMGSDIYTTDYTMDYTFTVSATIRHDLAAAAAGDGIDGDGDGGNGDGSGSAEELVFEVPFELNETQVMFVANKDVFVSGENAKAALEPVAEVILEHPEHNILLAGTTATTGKQASCEELSLKRAEAVKHLLVTVFGVPEQQLVTVGLGFEKDPFERGQDRDLKGNFISSEAAKNRRVVVMDINDPIAQGILAR